MTCVFESTQRVEWNGWTAIVRLTVRAPPVVGSCSSFLDMSAPAAGEEHDMLDHAHLLREIGVALFENIPADHKDIGMGRPCSITFVSLF